METIENNNYIIRLSTCIDFKQLSISSKSNKDKKLSAKNEWYNFLIHQDFHNNTLKYLTFNKIIDSTTTIMGRINFDKYNHINLGFIQFCSHKNSKKNVKQVNGIFYLALRKNFYSLEYIPRNGKYKYPLASGQIDEPITAELLNSICHKITKSIEKFTDKHGIKNVKISEFDFKEILNLEQNSLTNITDYANNNSDEDLLKRVRTYLHY